MATTLVPSGVRPSPYFTSKFLRDDSTFRSLRIGGQGARPSWPLMKFPSSGSSSQLIGWKLWLLEEGTDQGSLPCVSRVFRHVVGKDEGAPVFEVIAFSVEGFQAVSQCCPPASAPNASGGWWAHDGAYGVSNFPHDFGSAPSRILRRCRRVPRKFLCPDGDLCLAVAIDIKAVIQTWSFGSGVRR